MNAELLVLRILHVFGGVVWAGTSVFVAYFLLPAMGQAGPAGAPVMGALVKRKLFVIVPIIAVVVMLTGLRLMWIASSGFSATYFSTRTGQTYSVGAVLALTSFAIFMFVNHPAVGRIMQLGQQIAQAPDAEKGPLMAQLNAIRARAGLGSIVTAVLLSLAAMAMAIGRFV